MLMYDQIKEEYERIVRLICEKRLKDGIVELKEFLARTNDWTLQNNLEQIETAYNYMLDYMRQDIADPERKDLHHKLLRDTLSIADRAFVANLTEKVQSLSYSKALKSLKEAEHPYTLDSILIELESYTENYAVTHLLETEDSAAKLREVRRRHEDAQSALFALTWTTPVWNTEDEATAKRILESPLVPVNDLCLFISAITISLTESFDISKVMLLFDAYNHENNQINQRALVGLTIAFQLYHTRMPFYPELTARLSFLNEDEKFAKDLNRVQLQIIRSKDTDKISKKMREEIIPEMIKNATAHNMRINPDDNDEETDDINPDWMENLENSPLADKLREMTELQMEGADVYMGTFSSLKTYPFFNKINNWFYPFDKQHSLVGEEMQNGTGSSILDLILESAFFCDSDKYSLFFTMLHIPQSQRDMMIKQLSEQQMAEFMDEEKSNSIKTLSGKPEIVSNQYIQNLYRFFKVYPYRYEFLDLFKVPIQLNDYPVLKDIMHKPYLLKEIVFYFFKKEHYAEAAEVYNTLLKLEGDNAETYQQMGYCYQKLKDFKKALQCYLKADMLKPDNVWTNRRLATCYRAMNNFEKAVFYYKKVEEVQPENRSLLFNTGSCLSELERNDEALQYFFKLDFIEPENLRTWRAIAWCSFMLKKLDQAMKYYEKIIQKNGVAPDYLNAGHLAWILGDMKRAIEFYDKSCKLSGSKALFLDVFNKDKEFLLQNGISDYDIALMYDLL